MARGHGQGCDLGTWVCRAGRRLIGGTSSRCGGGLVWFKGRLGCGRNCGDPRPVESSAGWGRMVARLTLLHGWVGCSHKQRNTSGSG